MSSRVQHLRSPRGDQRGDTSSISELEIQDRPRSTLWNDEDSKMRAIWNCRSRTGMLGYQKTCGHWNVYIGWKIPKRIDLRCKKCGTRHQFRPGRTTTRGRKSQLHWIAFPNDVLQPLLEHEAIRRNGMTLDGARGFQTALDVHFESPREKTRRHLQDVCGTGSMYVPPVGGKSTSHQEKPKLTWWRRFLGFLRLIN